LFVLRECSRDPLKSNQGQFDVSRTPIRLACAALALGVAALTPKAAVVGTTACTTF